MSLTQSAHGSTFVSSGTHSETASAGKTAIVAGASLAGLMTSLALSRAGYLVTVLERSGDTGRTGAALYAPDNLVERLTGASSRGSAPMLGGTQTWFSVHAGLRSEAEADANIAIRDNTRVVDVGQDEHRAWVETAEAELLVADIVVGADGHRSVVRRAVSPEKPNATFAGYLIWLGLAEETSIVSRHLWPTSAAILSADHFHFLGVSAPSLEGSTAKGSRQLAWAIYDAGWNDLLRRTGCVRGNIVHHTLAAANVPDEAYSHLRRISGLWPKVWREAIMDCVSGRAIIGTPVPEYVPERLVNGRVALVGDAAHVPTPMTGNGFSASVTDAEVLAEALSSHRDPRLALSDYQDRRLDSVRGLVRGGQQFSRSFARK